MNEERKKETKKTEREREREKGYEVRRIAQISMQITNRTSDHADFHVCQWSDAFH